MEKSPLAPKRFPRLPAVAGVEFATVAAGVRYRRRADVTLFALARGTAIAGVFTRSSMPGAPVDWCKQRIKGGLARAIVVNAGNANVFTGRAGFAAVQATAAAAAGVLKTHEDQVFVASTGVIGEPLPAERIVHVMPQLVDGLAPGPWRKAAAAIMTTDTFAKGAARTAKIGGKPVQLVGIAKGSGMIQPDMATMLCFLFTDAKIPAPVLQRLLRQANAATFNCITVDGDTSTSDTLLLAATGKARHRKVASVRDAHLADFKAQLFDMMRDLAHQVVRDGEGAAKFISVTVKGAESRRAAHQIAMTIANSPLFKTAIAGKDANWGRIVMAVGRSGEKADRDRLSIRIGGVAVATRGHLDPDYREADVMPHMNGAEIELVVDVGVGRGRATVWTCDLTHGYIAINADYRS